MSIIQDIRDKYAKVTVVLIALALLGFVLTDYFQSQNRSGGGRLSNSLGSVNGKSIDINDFNNRVAQFEQQYKSQGYPAEMANSQARNQAWDNEVMRILIAEEISRLGITAGKTELGDILYGANPPADLKQQFTDSTGVYNASAAKQNIEQMLKKGTEEQKAGFNAFIDGTLEQRRQEKYMSLFSNSVNVPRWFVEKQNADNSQMAKVSYVKEFYTSIPDSTVKVDDKSIADYISKHKEDFKQEESRSIAYVSFSASPSKEDSADAVKRLEELRTGFATATDMKAFLAKNGANYYDGYISGKTIQIPVKDSIFRTPVGSVYGPYLDGGSFVLAKMEGVKTIPDTVKVRHILIGTQSRDMAAARKLVDSIATVIKNGTPFDSVVALSDDNPDAESPQQGKYKGGIYDRVTPGQMVAPFNDFIFGNAVGAKGVVPTEFGFHYVEILSQKGSGAAYKIAQLPAEIVPSQATDNAAQDKANAFFADSRNLKAFDETYEKKLKATGIQKQVANNIRPADASIGMAGTSRELVRAIYDAKLGEVLKPERVGEGYVVAVVTDVQKAGTMSVAAARPSVEGLLRNQKKAEMLKKKVGTVTTLEAAAAALGGKPVEVADSLRMDASSPVLGGERRVLGASFNPANKGKVVNEAIEGSQGLYVVKVEDVVTTPVANANVAEQRKQLTEQQKGQFGNPLGALRNAATIKDKRGERL